MSTKISADMTNNTILDSRFNGSRNFIYSNKRPQHHPLHIPYSHKRPRTQHYKSTTPLINQLLISPFNNYNPHIPPNFQNPNLVPPPLNPPLSVPGLPPPSSQQRVNLNLNQPTVNSFLGGFISLSNKKPQAPAAEDPIGLEFDSAKLKVRHEFVIRSLYVNLPRWEWHFRKMRNRVVKKKAKRVLESRKYFPSVDTNGRFMNGGEEEREIEKEMLGVLADEDQKECPLCMEGFEEFFCEEMNDWVYRGTDYLDETKGSTRGFYKSLIGRIVHAKCIYTKQEIKSLSVSKG